MPTIVEQIQRDALDNRVPVSTILRRVKIAAVKLGLGKVEEWVDQELNGYDGRVPEYRIVSGTPKAHDPYHGWIIVGGSIGQISRQAIRHSAAALEDLLARDGALAIPFPDEITERLNEDNDSPWATYALFIDRSHIVAIIDKVRTLVLDWALELEGAGVVGTEYSFGEKEKEKVKEPSVNISVGQIGSFIGNMGGGNSAAAITVSHLNVDQVRALADQIQKHAPDLKQAGVPEVAFEESLAALQAEIAKQNPDQIAVRSSLTDMRHAITGAAGNLIAEGVISMLDKLLN